MNQNRVKQKSLFIEQLNNDAGHKILRLIYDLTMYEHRYSSELLTNEQLRSLMAKAEIWSELRQYLSDEMKNKVENHTPPAKINTLPEEKQHPYLTGGR